MLPASREPAQHRGLESLADLRVDGLVLLLDENAEIVLRRVRTILRVRETDPSACLVLPRGAERSTATTLGHPLVLVTDGGDDPDGADLCVLSVLAKPVANLADLRPASRRFDDRGNTVDSSLPLSSSHDDDDTGARSHCFVRATDRDFERRHERAYDS